MIEYHELERAIAGGIDRGLKLGSRHLAEVLDKAAHPAVTVKTPTALPDGMVSPHTTWRGVEFIEIEKAMKILVEARRHNNCYAEEVVPSWRVLRRALGLPT